jgi:fumarate hydratase class II
MDEYRVETDSLGEVEVPKEALWGAQTQRAIANFPVSGLRLCRAMIYALGCIKEAAAMSNAELGRLPRPRAEAIALAARRVAEGEVDDQFPVDIFQTGSGTSSNMNFNEVIAHLATGQLGEAVHPNDDVNLGQSSNDVFPSAIHIAAVIQGEQLLAALIHLRDTISRRATELTDVVKTGRTHLMDAMPLTLGQELSGWAAQIDENCSRIQQTLRPLYNLALGGTAVGTGINTDRNFVTGCLPWLHQSTGIQFLEATNHFAAQSSMDDAAALSAQLKTLAVGLLKICNDLRWMNSGPTAGLAEITLPAVQPGSSIMPAKVNPVIPESTAMVCAQVIGNDAAITVAASSGNFQLNTMLPVFAHNLLYSLTILTNSCWLLADHAIAGFEVNRERLAEQLARNPVIATALTPKLGYDATAKIIQWAIETRTPIREAVLQKTKLSEQEVDRLLDPAALTRKS